MTLRFPSAARLLLGLTGAFALASCMESGRPLDGFAAALPPPPPSESAPPLASKGAIFQASAGYAGFHEGNRARRVGDVVTIVLVENLRTDKSASGQTNRNGSASITPPSAGPLGFLNPSALEAGAQGSFKGTGKAAQKSSLSGTIAVTIAELRPNGTARVVGEKRLLLTQGREWVQFSGIVRLADIDIDNRVFSTQVADARIVYSGKGAVQQASKPGWLSRFFNAISPF